jgi:hypothetical protein
LAKGKGCAALPGSQSDIWIMMSILSLALAWGKTGETALRWGVMRGGLSRTRGAFLRLPDFARVYAICQQFLGFVAPSRAFAKPTSG